MIWPLRITQNFDEHGANAVLNATLSPRVLVYATSSVHSVGSNVYWKSRACSTTEEKSASTFKNWKVLLYCVPNSTRVDPYIWNMKFFNVNLNCFVWLPVSGRSWNKRSGKVAGNRATSLRAPHYCILGLDSLVQAPSPSRFLRWCPLNAAAAASAASWFYRTRWLSPLGVYNLIFKGRLHFCITCGL